ncbi:nitrite reductase large subunit NirB [Blastopirellula sp. J2-11]|uniref:nitrite reductase large subunit NirB n=1 Tax=Blastopirellula sp. J2-11 TaxID=2943192 RepID=UPI0021C6E64F|nr:nitrite reductase large subunit NirB [Blastopirellula sp. J2-11]UUO07408.1 nitrite reductase large subunit NirB [Blastopirellula sp. J2-11]
MISPDPQTIVVVGNGMVGHRFVEKMIEMDIAQRYRIVTFCEEPRAAYDRVGLTSFFAHRDAEKLMLARLDWYKQHEVELHIGDRANRIDRAAQIVYSDRGAAIHYDHLVMATGSYPFVPDMPGVKHHGVFVYRTIEDLERIIEYGKKSKRCAVIGGGLLGLEAAKAAHDLDLETYVIEYNGRVMPRQLDEAGSKMLIEKISALGLKVLLNKGTKEIRGDGHVQQILFTDGTTLDVDMIIISAGIRPRDELAKDSQLELGKRGGVVVNDRLQSSDPNIYAIGEIAAHAGMIYGLVAPGYDMAEIAAANFCGQERTFNGADMSTKLKLMGCDVASFGQYNLPSEEARPLVWEDPFKGIYKKLLFTPDGSRLLGGMLVGDASDYGTLLILSKSDAPLPCDPATLIGAGGSGDKSAIGGVADMPDSAQICSCNNVTKGRICEAIRDEGIDTVGELKMCTKAGSGCGGCMPLVTDLLTAELKAAGKTANTDLCEHFSHTRQELYEIVQLKEIKSFPELIAQHGRGHGCETCKPAVASILASLWNDQILEPEHQTLQDSNDRFLANIQRGGSYSVVPRVPGGEITPEKLIVLGEVAKKYKLYTKITGGQRVDLFGAQVHELPEIWEELVNAGFESGHAYGKSVRTVKSCVGSTWCRYGIGDSVGFAIAIEERYRGLRSPHKLKFAVSGCVRECAEAQCKDVGLIATENGYNLYVCGNGGAKPRHADLLIADIDEATAITYIDRFLIYYIRTADKLMRTATWMEKLEGGLEHLKAVVIDDKLGVAEELEKQMQYLVDTYKCEWKEVVNNPEKRKWFRQFANTDEHQLDIELIEQRDQARPADWPKENVALVELKGLNGETIDHNGQANLRSWVRVGAVADFPLDGGAAIKYGQTQIAVFNFASQGNWYACQNMCPHKNAFVLSRGMIGTVGETPKVACPLHKKTFSLESGECLTGEEYAVKTFPVKIEADGVYLELPPETVLDAELATDKHCIRGCDAVNALQLAEA